MSPTPRVRAGSGARQARAERILDITAELLLAHGYRKVTVDDVARQAGIGKGTIYLHWRTREALLWAVLQRETTRLLETLIERLSTDIELALPHRLMSAIFLEVAQRPLVKALLLSDPEVLGALAADDAVAAAQRELAGNADYFELCRAQGLLRPELGVAQAGYLLESTILGFFAADGPEIDQRAELLAYVLRRTVEPDTEPPVAAVRVLNAEVMSLFRSLAATLRPEEADTP